MLKWGSRLTAVITCVGAVAAVAAGAGSAGLLPSCGDAAPVFAPWGDEASYTLIPDGDFESTGGWSLRDGAQIVADNEPYAVHDAQDSQALFLPDGGSATSGPLCIGLTTPGIRLFTTGAAVHVSVVVSGLLGVLSTLDGGTVPATGTWRPSARIATTIGQLDGLLGASSVQLRLSASGGGAEVDDVYLDPFLTR